MTPCTEHAPGVHVCRSRVVMRRIAQSQADAERIAELERGADLLRATCDNALKQRDAAWAERERLRGPDLPHFGSEDDDA